MRPNAGSEQAMNRRALVGSTLAHAGVVWALFFFVPGSPVRIAPTTIQVALVNLPPGRVAPSRGTPSDAPAPRPDEAATKDVKPAPVETPDRKAVRPPDATKAPPKRPAPGLPEGSTALPTAAMGASGLTGTLAVDGDFRWTYWLLAVRAAIDRNWGGSPGVITGGKPIRCTVYFRVDRNGRVNDIRLTESSGVGFFDQKAVRAVTVSDPLVRLPADYRNDWVGVHFGFEYSDD
jgi:TonB family protein